MCFLGYDLRARVFSHWPFLPYRDTCDIPSFFCVTPFSHEKLVCFQGERECGLKVILKRDSKERKRHTNCSQKVPEHNSPPQLWDRPAKVV